ncbi:hypothetical protein [uncultured Flavobacterium sp.]|uniref:hypothetical protein n=1 Tax=uncultured Flavobacterium sp. TaxID=165435 RepID=UPI0025FD96DF|nr:hypothetical protein [uncultured Flavobacterium sp.]
MKKILYLFLAVCLSASAYAQKLTDKDIQGNWKLASLEASGMTIDVANEKIVLPPEAQASLTEEQKTEMDAGMAQAMEMFRESYAKIEGKNLTQNLGPEGQSGTFVLSHKDGKNILTLTKDDGTTKNITVSIVDKKLRLQEDQEGVSAVFVYTKQ